MEVKSHWPICLYKLFVGDSAPWLRYEYFLINCFTQALVCDASLFLCNFHLWHLCIYSFAVNILMSWTCSSARMAVSSEVAWLDFCTQTDALRSPILQKTWGKCKGSKHRSRSDICWTWPDLVEALHALKRCFKSFSFWVMPRCRFYDVLWCVENMFSSPEASVDCPSQKTNIYHQLAGLTRLWIFEWSFFLNMSSWSIRELLEISNGEKPQARHVASDCKASVGCCSVGQVLFWKVVWACRNWTRVLHSTQLTKDIWVQYVEHALEGCSPVWAIFCWCF